MKLTIIVLVVLPFLLNLPGLTLAETSTELLISRHIEWRGGAEALRKLDAIHQTGSLSVAGLNGGITLSQRRDGYLYQSFDLGVFKSTEVTTPGDQWYINASGQVEDLGISYQQTHGRTLASTFLDTLVGETALDRKLMKPETRNGKNYAVLLKKPAGKTVIC